MLTAYRCIRNLSHIGFFCGAVFGSFLPAGAQFIPDKQVTVQHLKAPKEGQGFSRYYWLNDHELVYIQRTIGPDEQYYKLDITTQKEQALGGFTKIVRDTIKAHGSLPQIYPSPDRKYLAWVGTNDRSEAALVVATIDGSIIISKPSKTSIQYPAWSADSQWFFGFLEGEVPDDLFGGIRRAFKALTAVSIKVPSIGKTYPIALKSELQPNALSGRRGFAFQTSGPPIVLPDFYFGSQNNILLGSPIPGELVGEIQFDEYNIINTTMPVATYTLHLPAFGKFEYVVFSPQGDAIIWKFHLVDDEFRISDKDAGHMKRIGKFPHEHEYMPRFIYHDPDDMKWLPSGKGITFLEEGGLCVVYLDAHKVSE
ncbi:MAG: hypothetical protein JWL77_4812 [Chthonomonadaceae bacterium]|nr:hypothetical protein [Chthonomonadaceae bacterium]